MEGAVSFGFFVRLALGPLSVDTAMKVWFLVRLALWPSLGTISCFLLN